MCLRGAKNRQVARLACGVYGKPTTYKTEHHGGPWAHSAAALLLTWYRGQGNCQGKGKGASTSKHLNIKSPLEFPY
jgi:hypothetical protein